MLALDPGTTDSKEVFRVVRSDAVTSVELMMMGSQLAQISSESLARYKQRLLTARRPEDEAIVQYRGENYAVGFLAKNNYRAELPKAALKYEGAIPKVLAGVGTIAELKKIASPFSLALTIPLPYNEWEDRDIFELELKSALSNFRFREADLSVNCNFFKCFPEGGGHLLERGRQLGEKSYSSKIVSVIWGYRDLSILICDRGSLSGMTTKMGMRSAIEIVLTQTSGLDEQELLMALVKTNKRNPRRCFEALLKSTKAENRIQELEKIQLAVKYATEEVWEQVSRWLRDNIPSDADEIIIGGGTAHNYRSQLNSFFKTYRGVNLSWSAGLTQSVKDTFSLSHSDSSRVTDSYSLFCWMQNQLFPKLKLVKTA